MVWASIQEKIVSRRNKYIIYIYLSIYLPTCLPKLSNQITLPNQCLPQIKKSPLSFPVSWIYLVLQLLFSCLSSSLLWATYFIRSRLVSSSCCTARAWHSKLHKSTTMCRGCRRMTVYARHVNWLTWLDVWHMFTSSKVCNLRVHV